MVRKSQKKRSSPVEVGERIRLIEMGADEPCPIPPGSKGTVIAVCPGFWNLDGSWQISVKWDPEVQRSLALVWPQDKFEVIPSEPSEEQSGT